MGRDTEFNYGHNERCIWCDTAHSGGPENCPKEWNEAEFNRQGVPDVSRPPPEYGCHGTVECRVCGKHHGWCNELSQPNGDKNKMAGKNGSFKKLDFLKADDLPEKGKTVMEILGNTRTFDSEYGMKFNMDVRINKKSYSFGIKPTNPGLRVIIDSLATGKKIEVERGEYKGNEFVQVCGVPERK